MISSDEYYLQKSYQPYLDHFAFSKKEVIFVEDAQKGSYPSGNYVSFDLASMGLSNKYQNWEEAELVIPLVMSLACPSAANNGLTSDVSNAFACSLKNGYHQLINSLKINIGNNDIVNTQQYTNLKVHYDIVSSWSDGDVKTVGSRMNFHGIDNYESEEYVTTATTKVGGVGLCNNRITPFDVQNNWTPNGGYGGGCDDGNLSRRNRMQTTSFDPSNAANTISTFSSEALTAKVFKNYVVNTTSTANLFTNQVPILYYIIATIPLAQIHSLFKNMHLIKNAYFKIELNLNTNFTTTCSFAANASPKYASYTTSGSAPCCPFQVSPLGTNVASTGLNVTGLKPTNLTTSIQVQLQIAKAVVNNVTYTNPMLSNCRIYIPNYTLSPIEEERYLTTVPEKRIVFEDYQFSNTSLVNVSSNGSVYNSNLFSQKRIRGLLLIPQMASTVHPMGGGLFGSPLLSPFCGNGCCPYARVTNFNVLINNVGWYPQNINYSWETYTNEILKSKTPFGNSLTGIKAGLLTQQDWEINHSYIFVDLSRWESVSFDNQSKTVGISFTNSCNQAIDYHCFLIFEREITINTSTGQLVKKE